MKRLGILVSGGGTNMEAIVEGCASGALAGLAETAVVVSNKTGVGALERARRLGVPAEVVPHTEHPGREEHETAILARLEEHRVEVVVLAGYMRILTGSFLKRAPGPVVNIHPVPTHLYQGPAGYEEVWNRRGERRSNFPTVHFVDSGVDTGQVVLYGLPYRVSELETLEELRERGLQEEHHLYPEAIRYLLTVPLGEEELEASSSELTGVSHLTLDLIEASAEAKRGSGTRVLCMAQRDWQGTGYRLQIEGPDQSLEAKPGWLAGTERAAFTRLLNELLVLARELTVEFLYEGLKIDLSDSRRAD